MPCLLPLVMLIDCNCRSNIITHLQLSSLQRPHGKGRGRAKGWAVLNLSDLTLTTFVQ